MEQFITQNGLGLEAFKHQEWAVNLPAGMAYKTVLDQKAWMHVASKFRAGDIIHVRSVDHSFYAKLYVRACDKLWLQASELEFHEFGAGVKTSSGGYEIKWSSPKTLFGVYRKSDGERIKDMFQTKELAAQWLENHRNETETAAA